MTTNIQTERLESKFEIRRGIWDNRPRLLQIHNDFLEFEDKDLINNHNTRLAKESITGYKFGIKWIQGFKFTVGREYRIYVRNDEQKELKIFFKSFYGYKKKELNAVYSDIIEELWNYYFSEIVVNYLAEFRKGSEIQIEKISLNDIGLKLSPKTFIPWSQVGTKSYHTYFAIFSKEDPAKNHMTFSYLDDWNTGIIYSVVQTILQNMEKAGN